MAVLKNMRHESKEMKLITVSRKLLQETARLLCREKTFPKRSRWLFGNKIMNVANDYYIFLHMANEIDAISCNSAELARERIKYSGLAYASLMSLESEMTSAVTILGVEVDELETWATLLDDSRTLLMSWRNKDNIRLATLLNS